MTISGRSDNAVSTRSGSTDLTTRLTEELVSLAKSYSDDAEEAAATFRGGSFAEWAMISLHGLRIFLEKSYVMTIDLLETMSQILEIIGLEPDDLPAPSTFGSSHHS
ncbi:transposase IS5 family protein [Halalkaliarchaeum desulfuricum]|uniref:Transposase IS5 family protein n=1 Tax=Halalkaliarchaeum desulfuricum TaxID=2055893 RepID=A0A343TL72_9EURY|nr:transposase IS5 family protein [Halalkaliarchaeum desulfuricum]